MKYFIDHRKYNCPFCKTNSVSYELLAIKSYSEEWQENDVLTLDTEKNKQYFVYFIKCWNSECLKISIHWSKKELRETYKDISISSYHSHKPRYKDIFSSDIKDLDEEIIFSYPTSSFTLDENIPKKIRDLIEESERCLNLNALTWSSACLRKAIYTFIEIENCRVEKFPWRIDFAGSLDKLKNKYPLLINFLSELGNIQELTSDLVHESSWKEWNSEKLKFLIALTKKILEKVYVEPKSHDEDIRILNNLKNGIK